MAGCSLVVVVVVRRRGSEGANAAAAQPSAGTRRCDRWVNVFPAGRREVVGGSKLGRSNRVLVRQTNCRHNRVCDSLGIEISQEAGVPAVRMVDGGSLREIGCTVCDNGWCEYRSRTDILIDGKDRTVLGKSAPARNLVRMSRHAAVVSGAACLVLLLLVLRRARFETRIRGAMLLTWL